MRRYVIDLPDGERGIAVAEALRSCARLFLAMAEAAPRPLPSTDIGHAALSALLAGRVEEVPR